MSVFGRSMALTAVAATLVATLASMGTAQVGLRATTLLQTPTDTGGKPIQFPLFRNQWRILLLEIAPGGEIGRHRHAVPHVVYILEAN